MARPRRPARHTRRAYATLALAMAVLVGLAACAPPQARSPTAEPQPAPSAGPESSGEAFLQAEGPVLRYRGAAVVLKGTNFDNVPALGAGIGSGSLADIGITEADYSALSAQGANHARFGLSFGWYRAGRDALFAQLDQQVAWARKHNLWLIFTLYTTPGDCYEGYSTSCGIWDDPAEQQELQAFWVDLAGHYSDEPAVAGFGLLNEPTPPAGCAQWFAVAGAVYEAVAAVAPRQLQFIGSCSDPRNDLQQAQLPRGPNIVYEVHDYSPIELSHATAASQATYPGTVAEWFGSCYFTKATFAGAVHTGDLPLCAAADLRERYGIGWASREGVPIYVGEWGASGFLEGANQFHRDKAELYRDWGLHHAHYTWKHNTIKTGGDHIWGIYAYPLRLDDPEKLAAVRIAWEGAVRPAFADGAGGP